MSDANLQDGWVKIGEAGVNKWTKIGEVGVDCEAIRIGDTHYVSKFRGKMGCYDVLAQMEEIDGYMTVTRVMIDFESKSAGCSTTKDDGDEQC